MNGLSAPSNGLKDHIDDLEWRLGGRIDRIATPRNPRIDGLAIGTETSPSHESKGSDG